MGTVTISLAVAHRLDTYRGFGDVVERVRRDVFDVGRTLHDGLDARQRQDQRSVVGSGFARRFAGTRSGAWLARHI